jgi:predicted lipid-binding transport protein (Tim44 family)
MNYNNRGNRQIYGTGCSFFGCLIAILFFGFILRGSIFFFFRYFWLILIIGVVIWGFRKFVQSDDDNDRQNQQQNNRQSRNWSRDFENRQDTGYDNFDRDFEEVDEEDSQNNDEDDEFSDF